MSLLRAHEQISREWSQTSTSWTVNRDFMEKAVAFKIPMRSRSWRRHVRRVKAAGGTPEVRDRWFLKRPDRREWSRILESNALLNSAFSEASGWSEVFR